MLPLVLLPFPLESPRMLCHVGSDESETMCAGALIWMYGVDELDHSRLRLMLLVGRSAAGLPTTPLLPNHRQLLSFQRRGFFRARHLKSDQ